MEQDDTMTVQEPVAAYGIRTYADVMYFIHTLPITPEVKEQVGHRLVKEVTGKNLSRAFARLDHLAQLPNDWDGRGAMPVSRQVLNNVKSVLSISDDDDWSEWMIGPDSNATLGLQSKTTKAAMSIGVDEYSYFARIKGKRYGESHVKFTPEAFLETMRRIS